MVAAEPRATEAAATNAMVMKGDELGDGQRGDRMRVDVRVSDDRDGWERERECGLRRRGGGQGRGDTRIRPALLCLGNQKNRGCPDLAHTPAARRGDLAPRCRPDHTGHTFTAWTIDERGGREATRPGPLSPSGPAPGPHKAPDHRSGAANCPAW